MGFLTLFIQVLRLNTMITQGKVFQFRASFSDGSNDYNIEATGGVYGTADFIPPTEHDAPIEDFDRINGFQEIMETIFMASTSGHAHQYYKKRIVHDDETTKDIDETADLLIHIQVHKV